MCPKFLCPPKKSQIPRNPIIPFQKIKQSLVAHIVPEAAWYVIPVAALLERKTVRLYPHPYLQGEYRRSREAWPQLFKTRVMEQRRS